MKILLYEEGSITDNDKAMLAKMGIVTLCYCKGANKPELIDVSDTQNETSAIGFNEDYNLDKNCWKIF